MRKEIHQLEVELFFDRLAVLAKGPGTVYITGGASAVLLGWRLSTVDIDIKLSPEPAGIFQAIQEIKNSLHMNIELASPDDFVPVLPGWQSRSQYICTKNRVDFYHYDFYGQALSKIVRGHERDLQDVNAMLDHNHIEKAQLWRLYYAIAGDFIRFPAIDTRLLKGKLEKQLGKIS